VHFKCHLVTQTHINRGAGCTSTSTSLFCCYAQVRRAKGEGCSYNDEWGNKKHGVSQT
jgi:hypothetical protein